MNKMTSKKTQLTTMEQCLANVTAHFQVTIPDLELQHTVSGTQHFLTECKNNSKPGKNKPANTPYFRFRQQRKPDAQMHMLFQDHPDAINYMFRKIVREQLTIGMFRNKPDSDDYIYRSIDLYAGDAMITPKSVDIKAYIDHLNARQFTTFIFDQIKDTPLDENLTFSYQPKHHSVGKSEIKISQRYSNQEILTKLVIDYLNY